MNEDMSVSPMASTVAPAPRTRWVWTTVVVVVIIILVLGGGWWFYGRQSDVVQIAPGVTLTKAPAGTVTPDFPQELILEKDAPLTGSYTIAYQVGNAKQPVVSYLSSKSVQENVIAFRVYLVTNGWTLIQQGNPLDKPATFIFATKDAAQVNITLQGTAESKTEVSISYLVKG